MKKRSWICRLAAGQTLVPAAVLIAAYVLGVLPDPTSSRFAARASLCETVTLNASADVARNDFRKVQTMLRMVVERNSDLLSAAVRRDDGALLVEVGKHEPRWQCPDDGCSTDSQIIIPIYSNDARWGAVEFRFEPLEPTGVAAAIDDPWLVPFVFVVGGTFIANLAHLKRTLVKVDPAGAVPHGIKSAVDGLTHGVLVVDRCERVVLANDAFSSLVGKPTEQLLGRRLTEFPWMRLNDFRGDDRPYVWQTALGGNPSSGNELLYLRLSEQKRPLLLVESSPIREGEDEQCRGAFISVSDVTRFAPVFHRLASPEQELVARTRG